MGKTVLCFSLILFLLTAGCEDTDIGLATQAGIDAVRAVSLDDAEVRRTAVALAQQFDLKHTVAPSANPYAKRLGVAPAISALTKLAATGNDHSLLSSHPAPEARATRLRENVSGSRPAAKPSLLRRVVVWLQGLWPFEEGK
jgi:hypothetical protein